MSFETQNRRRFRELTAGSDAAIDLGEATLLIAAEVYWDLEVAAQLATIDDLGTQLRFRLRGVSGARSRAEVLCRFLAEEIGFTGDVDGYYDPRNSYLPDVLERRLGIPITLSVVYLEVARRAGVELVGIAFPGHFLIRDVQDLDVIVDPFHGGRILDRADAGSLLSVISDGKIAFSEALLAPATKRGTLLRILRNLQALHEDARRYAALAACIDLQLILAPGSAEAHVVRGVAHLQMGAPAFAKQDFERYLDLAPDGPHIDAVRAELATMSDDWGPRC